MGCDGSTPVKGESPSKGKSTEKGYRSLDRQKRRASIMDTAGSDPITSRPKRQLDLRRVVSPDDVGFFCTIHRDDELEEDPCPDSAREKSGESVDVYGGMEGGTSFEAVDESVEERILMQRYNRIRQALNDDPNRCGKKSAPWEFSPTSHSSFTLN
jgi:hypothetical protein